MKQAHPAMSPTRTLLTEPLAAWQRADRPWRLAYVVGITLMLVGAAHGAAWLVVGGAWDGPVSFRKPFSFGMSFGLTTITLAWFADRMRLGRRAGWALLAPLALANTIEVVWVSLQRMRGVASHFNFATPLDETLFKLMGAGAVTVSALVILALTVVAFRRGTDDSALTLAIRVGLVLLLVSMIGGGAMLSVGNARAELGQTDDLVRWGAAGNMKATHALGLHGIQVLPAVAVWLSATAMAATIRTRIVAVAAAGYSGLLAAGTLQWLQGHALTEVGWLDGVIWVPSSAALAAAMAMALRAARSSGPIIHSRA